MGAIVAFGLVLLVWLPLLFMAREGVRLKQVRQSDGSQSTQSVLVIAITDPRLGRAVQTSVTVAICAGGLATIIVVTNTCALRLAAARLASHAVAHAASRWLSFLALLVPELALALGAAIVLTWAGLGRSFAGLVYAHTLLACLVGMPVALTLTDRIPLATEMAALDSGCGSIQAACRITIPTHRHVFLAVLILSALLSFEDFVIALFVAPSGVTTLPLYVFSLIKFRRLEESNALGLLLTLLALIAVFALYKLTGRGERHPANP